MPNVDLVIGYLSFINEKNKHIRLDDLKSSVESTKIIGSDRRKLISVDNASIQDARDVLTKASNFDAFFHYDTNHYDVALFFTTMWYALIHNTPYMVWFYDDFIVYDDALEDCMRFLDENNDVHCVRLPIYDKYDSDSYDTKYVSKQKNPDSVRHFNTVSNRVLEWKGPHDVGRHQFFTNNWHYTSRPMMWRTRYFHDVTSHMGSKCYVLQGFESRATAAFEKAGLKTGVLQGGMMRTTPVNRSARNLALTLNQEMSTSIELSTLRSEFDKLLS
jgi:hypothetical protein